MVRNYSIKELNVLIDRIKQALPGLSEGDISIRAGYNSGYIAQTKSREVIPKKLIDNLKREFREELQNANLSVPHGIPYNNNKSKSSNSPTAHLKAHRGGKDENKEVTTGVADPVLSKYIALLERENDLKNNIIEFNLTGIAVSLKSTLAHLAVGLEYDALRDAGGNEKKADQIKEGMDRRIGEVLSGSKKKDRASGKIGSK